MGALLMSGSDIAKHRSADSCWTVIHGKVYDVTNFLDKHPGGRSLLLKQAGADATPEFAKVHSEEVVDDLPDGSYLGDLDPSTAGALASPITATGSSAPRDGEVVPVSLCVRADDFEREARKILDRRSWVYASSSANSGASLAGNLASWGRVTFRPRVLRDVAVVSSRRSVLGHSGVVPFYVSPMGSMGLFHPDGEYELMRALARKGVHAIVSTASTKSLGGIMNRHVKELEAVGGAAKSPSRLFFQLYLPVDRERAQMLVRKVREAGYKGLVITVDTAVLGKRSEDRKKQAEETLEDGLDHSTIPPPTETGESDNEFSPSVGARSVAGTLSPSVTWKDLEWIRREWSGPVVLKGIQTAEDARLAAENNCQGIILSNHGGRQQHTAPSALSTLLEIRTYSPEVLDKMEVFVDGGCRDGADILKALALGATAVGIGRPVLYAMAAYGSKGVEQLIDVLSEEVNLAMALLGVTSLDQLRPEMVNATPLLNEMWRPELPSIRSRL